MQILIVLTILVSLALLASSKRLWAWRRGPVGAMLTTGGWLMVVIGMLLGPHAFALVGYEHLDVLRPLILFCLGWVGLLVGMQLRLDLPRLLPTHTLRLMTWDFVVTMVLTTSVGAAALWVMQSDTGWRDRLITGGLLAACSLGWSAEVRSLGGGEAKHHAVAAVLRSSSGLASIFAVLAYGLIFMLLRRDSDTAFSMLPFLVGTVMSLMIALTIGLLGYWLIHMADNSDSQFLVVLLGLVSLAAGASATMGHSPLFVGLLSGAVLVNMPGDLLMRFRRVIVDAEQPVAMALMLTAGVLADPRGGWMVAVLIAVLLPLRAVAKWLITGREIQQLSHGDQSSQLSWGPLRQSPLAVALAIGYAASAQTGYGVGVLSGGQLLAVVIMVGLISDMLPLIRRHAQQPTDLIRPRATKGDTP